MSPFQVTATLALALAACGSGSPSPSAPPAPIEHPPADPSPGFGACGEGWVSSPDDPRAGIYLFERYAGGGDETSAFMNLLAYDGESLILRRLPTRGGGRDECVYGSADTAPPGVVAMHAEVAADGQIYALQPCFGWVCVGRFVEGDRIETTYPDSPPYLLRRLDRREVEGELRAELEAIDFFACRDAYEAEGTPLPPVPGRVSSGATFLRARETVTVGCDHVPEAAPCSERQAAPRCRDRLRGDPGVIGARSISVGTRRWAEERGGWRGPRAIMRDVQTGGCRRPRGRIASWRRVALGWLARTRRGDGPRRCL